MDFDKIKKAAKDTIKMVGDKVEDKFSTRDINIAPTDSADFVDDLDDFSIDSDEMGQTKKFGLKEAINQLNKQKDGFSGTLSDIFGKNQTDNNENVSSNEQSKLDGSDANSSDNTSKTNNTKSTDCSIVTEELEKVQASISKITNDIAEIRSNSAVSESTIDKLSVSVAGIDRKLNEISSSLSGVGKLSDSLFDLKNSQVNTKNSLGDLEVSFRRLKKKMTVSVVILSVIAVITAVLEVINLLS